MKYFTIPPPPHLARYVRCFWVLESDHPFYIHRSLASTCPELIFHYKGRFDELLPGDERVRSFTSGIHSQGRHIRRFRIDEGFGIFGTYLYPYTVPVLFGIPSSELTDQHADLHSLLGEEGKILEEKIMLAKDYCERVRLVSAHLERKLSRVKREPHAILSSVHFVMQTKGTVKVTHLAEQYSRSNRQFERNFTYYTGFSPKMFSRITRFHAVLDAYGRTGGRTLTEIALHAGYYDQSHFIHDFKEFSGHHPKKFFSSPSTEGAPIPETP